MQARMKMMIVVGILLLSLVGPRIGNVGAQSAETTITPLSYSTQRGGTGGQPASALAMMDQFNTDDNPTAYVLFTTPGSVYSGIQVFQMPGGVANTSVATMKLVVNFKGPLSATQKWSWSLYNFTKNSWMVIGNNNGVSKSSTWTRLEFSVTNPANFISSDGVVRVLLRSSNATNDAKIDYEAVVFTATTASTATLFPPTATATATSIPWTATASPTATLIPPTFTASPTATSIPKTATPTAVSGNVYYVSPLGNDSNPGTQAQPWRTIQKAANTVSAGSTVLVQAGTYAERVSVTRSGSSGAPITFQAQGTVAMNGFTLSSANFVTISGFEISNKSLDSRAGWGIHLTGNNNVIMNNYIHDTTWGGVLLYATTLNPTQSSNNLVQGNRIAHLGEVGIDVRGRNNVVSYNEISAVMQYPSWLTNPPSWVDADGIHFHGSGHIIRGNYIHDILFSMSENVNPHIDCFQTFSASPDKEGASNVILEKNRCDNAQAQTSLEVGKGFMVQNATNLTIRNNIINAYVGMNANRYSSNLTIVNNTFTSDVTLTTAYSPSGITMDSVPNSVIKNNIFFNLPGQIIYLVNTTVASGRNLMYRNDGKTLVSSNTYSHVNDLWGVNPLFVSALDFHLQAGSPAIDAGMSVSVLDDYDGNSRPSGIGYEIGAYER